MDFGGGAMGTSAIGEKDGDAPCRVVVAVRFKFTVQRSIFSTQVKLILLSTYKLTTELTCYYEGRFSCSNQRSQLASFFLTCGLRSELDYGLD